MSNLNKIFNIVEKHFDLNDKSLEKFKHSIYNPFIDDTYKQILGNSGDLRKRFKIAEEDLEFFDEGWKIFQHLFGSFINYYNILYKDFRKNKVVVDKQKIKIKKALINYYTKFGNEEARNADGFRGMPIDLAKQAIKEKIEIIGVKKFPSGSLEIVLSLNFADWFLCSTAESWTSCLNLESEYSYAVWSGLPGLISDKNRAMIYITNGKKKNYNGIEIDKFISRSWILLDEKNNINIVRFFPSKILNIQSIQKTINKKFKKIDNDFISKHAIDLLYFKNNKSSFIYNDKVSFSLPSLHLISRNGGGGVQIFEDGVLSDSVVFRFGGGLNKLIKNNISLCNIHYGICSFCEKTITKESELCHFKNKILCINCYRENITKCTACGHSALKTQMQKIANGYFYCQECIEKHFTICNCCNNLVAKKEVIEKDSKKYCHKCIEENKIENIVQCSKCEKWNSKAVPVAFQLFDETWICNECRKEQNSWQIKLEPFPVKWEISPAPAYCTTTNATGWATTSYRYTPYDYNSNSST